MISPIGKFSVPPGRVDMRIILIGAWLLREQLHHDPASNMKQGSGSRVWKGIRFWHHETGKGNEEDSFIHVQGGPQQHIIELSRSIFILSPLLGWLHTFVPIR